MVAADQWVGFIITGMDQQIVEVDDAYVAIVRRSRDDLIGRTALSFTHALDMPHNQPLLDQLSASGPGFSITKRYVRGDGTLVWVQNHVTKVPVALGGCQLIATCREVTKPIGSEALARNYDTVKKLCAGLFAGKRELGADIIHAPAIEAILHLYKIEMEGKAIDVAELAALVDIAPNVMLRWIRLLSERMLVEVEDRRSIKSGSSVRIAGDCERALNDLLSRMTH